MRMSLSDQESISLLTDEGNEPQSNKEEAGVQPIDLAEDGGYGDKISVADDLKCANCSSVKLFCYGLLMLALVCHEVAASANQAMYRTVPDIQLNIFRQATLVLLTGPIMVIKYEWPVIKREDYFKAIFMTVTELFAGLLYFAGVSLLPLSLATGFFMGTNMIFISISMKFLFGNRMTLLLKFALLVSLFGLLLQSQPWKSFGDGFIPGFIEVNHKNVASLMNQQSTNISNFTKKITNYENDTRHFVLLGYILVLFSSIFETFFMILIGEYLTLVDPYTLTFISAFLQIPLSIIAMLCIEQPLLVFKPWTLSLITLHCVANGIAEISANTCYQILPLVHVTIVESMQTVLGLIPQYTIFSQHLGGRMNTAEVLGGVLILLSSILSSISMLD